MTTATARYQEAERLAQGMTQSDVLAETRRLLQSNRCADTAMRLLTLFGYAAEGRPCVPVYRKDDEPVIADLAGQVKAWLLEPVCEVFARMRGELDVLSLRHGVAPRELANELWHVLFGTLNEALVRRGVIASPRYRAGEGRYLQSI